MTETRALFHSLRAQNPSAHVRNEIVDAIREGKLGAGERLPSERELAEQFGVSRVTVRDALRILEAGGLIEIRVGARGGAIVTAPGASRIGEGITNMLRMSDVTPSNVTEARLVFELGAIPLVCERADDADIDDLLAICDRANAALADGTFHVGISADFHTRLAHATHNPAVGMMIDSFQGPLLMSLQHAKQMAPGMGREGTDEHRKLVAAIADRDVGRAEAIMRAHLTRTPTRLGITDADTTAGRLT